MGFIYQITNQINGKMYIGKTEYPNPNDRWREHKKNYNTKRCEKRPLYAAMNKYGISNFIFEVIDSVDDSDELCDLEKYYIELYRTYVGFKDCNGYNATLGGDGKCYLNLNENEVISVHIKNGYVSTRTAKYFGVDKKTIQQILVKHNVLWLSCEEITEKMFVDKYGGVIQFDFDMTQIIKMYNSPKYVLLENQNYKYKTLKDVLRPNHNTHHAYGYTWYRLNELPDEYKPLLNNYYTKQEEKDNERLLQIYKTGY